MSLTVLLGGVRSGKSARAVAVAAASSGRVLFVATAQAFDDDMARRIAAHRAERPPSWDTLEAPSTLAEDVAAAITRAVVAGAPYRAIVIDCLTLWVSNLLLALDDDDDAEARIADRVRELLVVWRMSQSLGTHWIVVSNEVGLGVVPPTPLGRRYRDALGRANQLVAAAANDVTLMVAGLAVPLKTP